MQKNKTEQNISEVQARGGAYSPTSGEAEVKGHVSPGVCGWSGQQHSRTPSLKKEKDRETL
jgi:hypothetical protein